MKGKQVYLTKEERRAIQTMVSMEIEWNSIKIQSNIRCKEMSIEPAFGTEMLKALYKKIAGSAWRAD